MISSTVHTSVFTHTQSFIFHKGFLTPGLFPQKRNCMVSQAQLFVRQQQLPTQLPELDDKPKWLNGDSLTVSWIRFSFT